METGKIKRKEPAYKMFFSVILVGLFSIFMGATLGKIIKDADRGYKDPKPKVHVYHKCVCED